ncbi:MAG: hypothetical protein Ct9H300mP12_02510 [Acidimicrobiales bacterium]|nr:MAG: hypothetical protein Ct9H300mP12_02510 [Acidimicrobiales bacterium]
MVLAPVETTSIGSAGSTSASRQTWMSGGAVQMACESVRRELLTRVAAPYDVSVHDLVLVDGRVCSLPGSGPGDEYLSIDLPLDEVTAEAVEADVVHRHAPTLPLEPMAKATLTCRSPCRPTGPSSMWIQTSGW